MNTENVSLKLLPGASLTGSGDLTIKKYLLWSAGAVNCPITIEATAQADLANYAGNTSLNSTLNNYGKVVSSVVNMNLNNGKINNYKEYQVFYSKFLNGTGTNGFYNCGKVVAFGNPLAPPSEILVQYTECPAQSGVLSGSGTVTFIDPKIILLVSPGASPGTLTINPSIVSISTSIFDMEIIGGYGAAGITDDADKLVSSGNIEINGTLLLRLTNPENGNYTIIDGTSLTGNFTSIQYSVNGGAFTTTKPNSVTISYDNAEGTVTVSISAVLPVELARFEGKNTEGGNLLIWQTAQEVNTSHFNIERSTDGLIFEKISETQAQGKAATYEYLDKYPLSTNTYYRLKMNDLDGKSSYSNVVGITNKQKGLSSKVYPNPFGDNLNIEISTYKKSDITIELIDILGRQVYQTKVTNTEGVLNLPISSRGLPNGTYFLKIKDGLNSIEHKVVKNRN